MTDPNLVELGALFSAKSPPVLASLNGITGSLTVGVRNRHGRVQLIKSFEWRELSAMEQDRATAMLLEKMAEWLRYSTSRAPSLTAEQFKGSERGRGEVQGAAGDCT